MGTHRHTPESEQILGLEGRLVFTPHLAPLNRGLLSTVTLPLAPGAAPTTEELVELYRDFYAACPSWTPACSRARRRWREPAAPKWAWRYTPPA